MFTQLSVPKDYLLCLQRGLTELYWATHPSPTVVDLGFVDGELIHMDPPERDPDEGTEGAETGGRESAVTDRSASPAKSVKCKCVFIYTCVLIFQ